MAHAFSTQKTHRFPRYLPFSLKHVSVWVKGVSVQGRTKVLVGFGVIAVAVAVAIGWWLGRDTIAEVSLDQALEDSAEAGEANDTPVTLDGTWRVSQTAESFAGVRIDEELRGVGSVTAVLRTPDVTGTLTLDDGLLTALAIDVDLTTLSSDDVRRDRSIGSAIDFANFPNATFTLDTPVDVSGLTAGAVSFDVEGTLAINGVQNPVVATVTADTSGGALVAVAQIPVTFADFSVQLPSAPIVLSINDFGTVETQLRFVQN